jgi:TonB family protein
MERTRMKERGISILVSVIFHAVMLFLLIRLFQPVRVYLFRHAADVRIIDPLMISFPRTEGLSEDRTAESASLPMSSEKISLRGTDDLQRIDPGPGIVYLKNLNISPDKEQRAESFDLIPSPKREGHFSLAISQKKLSQEKGREKDTFKSLDFFKLNTPALSSLQFNRILTDREGGTLSGQRDVSDRTAGFDLTPWIKQAVDKIRDKWTPPPIDESIALGRVRILIIIGKDGNLVGLKMLESSDFQVFDRTTIAAIRSSVPFPPLPVDFPNERLEALLVFEFHE